MARPLSLSGRITLFTTLGLAAFWLAATLLMTIVLWSEQEEFFDQQLAETAHVLLPLLSRAGADGADDYLPAKQLPLDEAVLYRLIDRDGGVLRQSSQVAEVTLPPPSALPAEDFATEGAYRFYTTGADQNGRALQLAAPLAERHEAMQEGMTALLLPMLALLPLSWLLVGWIARRSVAPMRELQAEISARDGSRLDMIDASNWPTDLAQIAGTVNGFMARLGTALDAERAFATNAAHELRTPVAIALARTQQLRESASTPQQITRIDSLETALQRMKRLVARLLQLARADAGIGASSEAHDLVPLTRFALDDVVPRKGGREVTVDLPDQPVMGHIDPDGYAIVLGNLVENALQHSETGGVRVRLTPDAVLEVENDLATPGPVDLSQLTGRFTRHEGDGFGLGLHICNQIIEGAKGRLTIETPQGRRFLIRVALPRAASDTRLRE
ncbi:sensor histidine kinase [Paracoccus sulfuroxidans]|uniref:histidine kinase n=1 Tax=Paracoccus sulfuroxidans TaxID=384678 RepID=A0A562NM07_9RHOB|nr:HAMP domain-containing sensor histidine kinase [Paracoccus sulfuroxidans]TWI33198.1 two-component system OmpR family sensor kinase [Paracoccus sulfuroxidans]